MKRSSKILLISLGSVVALGATALGALFATYDAEIVPGYELGGKPLKGKKSDVTKAINTWYSEGSAKPLMLTHKSYGKKSYKTTLADMGCSLDADKEAGKLKYRDFFTNLIGGYNEPVKTKTDVHPALQCELGKQDDLKKFVKENHPEIGKAKATYSGGKIQLAYENVSMELDPEKLESAVLEAFENDGEGKLPLKHAPKHIPDEELERITTVMSEFKTTFNAGKVSRSTNIRLAASRINGIVLMPGESFSFNGYLGQRTTAKGFKTAGVYVAGRHDIDVGGGICQVSTTLYNAAVRSDLKINTRSPHSLPVPYVPLGQDAAVSYPNPDLKLSNPYDFPIALSATPEQSTITFRVLGAEKPTYTYKFESVLISTWSRGEKVVHDGSLGYGVRKVMDNGGAGRKVRTYKLTYKDGKLVKRESMGDSTYSGGPRIIAVNKSAKPAAKPVSQNQSETIPANIHPESD